MCLRCQLKPGVQGMWGSVLCPSQASMSHLIPARLPGKSPDFSPWLSLLLFDARVPFPARRMGRLQAALGVWLLAEITAGRGAKGRCVSLVRLQPGSPLPWQQDGVWLCFQLPLLTCFCLHFLLPGEGQLGHGESPSSVGLWWEPGRQQHEPYPGVPQALPTF